MELLFYQEETDDNILSNQISAMKKNGDEGDKECRGGWTWCGIKQDGPGSPLKK